MTDIFISASPATRSVVLPEMISGFVTELTDEQVKRQAVEIEIIDLKTGEEAHLSLEGRPTGRRYRDLPWWEVVFK